MVSEVSILIPVFNYDITSLVHELLEQCQQVQIQFEIICLDDGSDNSYKIANQKLKFLNNVIYDELPANIGRAAIRNNLAQRAQFAYLLFLDNDSRLATHQFIANYLQVANLYSVLIGGTVYHFQPPPVLYRLHWRYGKEREQRKAAIRQIHPYRQIQVNNLLISRSLYLANPIPEIFRTYGHEDTLWGKHLETAEITVLHIDNPVCHVGLEPTSTFLIKTEQAIYNLVTLTSQEPGSISTNLIQFYNFLKKIGAEPLFYWIFKKVESLLLLQLNSTRPSLFLFDIYKLGLFVQGIKKVNG